MDRQRVIVVLGAHRSGTSLLAGALQSLGVAFGERLLDANEWNPRGYFEHGGIVAVNDALLAAAGARWDSLVVPATAAAAPALRERALELLDGEFAGAPLCGIKDPRASRLLPFWQDVFAQAALQDSYLLAVRNPQSVARSLAARDGIRPEKSSLLWLAHMLAAIRGTAGRPRIVVDYDTMLADPELQVWRIATALQLDIDANRCARFCHDFVASELRHAHDEHGAIGADPRIVSEVAQAWELLREMAREDGIGAGESAARRQAWSGLEQRFADMEPLLRYLDSCEDRITLLQPQPPEQATAAPQHGPEPVPATRPALVESSTAVAAAAGSTSVSVVIPLFNHEDFVEQAIASALQQTLEPLEVIVVDDGSVDGSVERVRRLAAEHNRIRLWQRSNHGAHHALNAAIHLASGDYVAILNSDDRFSPERLAQCIAVLEADPAIDCVVTGATSIDRAGRPRENAWHADALEFYRASGDAGLALFRANFALSTSNLVVRRGLFDAVGFFGALRYAHDLEFLLRLVLLGRRIHLIDAPLLEYRIHAANTIAESQAALETELAVVYAFFLHRRALAEPDAARAWLEPYIAILATRNLLEPVEFVLGQLRGTAALSTQAPGLAFQQLLARLGATPGAPRSGDSLLAELVTARNEYLRRWERAAPGSRELAKMVEQQQLLARLHAEIEILNTVVADKDRAASSQAGEIHRLHDVIVAKNEAVAVQAAEIHRIEDAYAGRGQQVDAQAEQITAQAGQIAEQTGQIAEQAAQLAAQTEQLAAQARQVEQLETARQALSGEVRRLDEATQAAERALWALRNGNWHRLGATIREEKLSLGKLGRIAWYAAACATPQRFKPALQPLADRLRGISAPAPVPAPVPGERRVVHVIANFMLGGSSRLVADLVEGLGDGYRHRVLTSYLPDPPAYPGIDVIELRPHAPEEVLPLLRDFAPQLAHVHYWGDCDWGWYDVLFRALEQLGCRVIENLNTPVAPYRAGFVDRYVHVSDYVQREFGDPAARNLTIHPGSDLRLFTRRADVPHAEDCIGMVYRLEKDKLDLSAIDVFVKVLQRRPQTRAIIVGGGTLLTPFQEAAARAGVAGRIEFTGYVDYARLPALYERMSVFVAPVHSESFGQVTPFAMGIGLPVAGYDIGGLAEIVADPACLAPPGDSDALAAIVIALLEDAPRRHALGARNRARAQQHFALDAMVDAYRRLYEELLGVSR